VAHKGFPRQQDVLSAINDICGLPRPGDEMDFRQKREFQDYICGESDNRHHECCTFWVTTLALWGYAVAQLVEALCYKPEGCGFDSRWCHWRIFN
jgi:hypothetical protein